MDHLLNDSEEPIRRVRVLEPRNSYEFCQAFSKVTKRPLGFFLKSSKGWPIEWFFQLQSECKQSNNQAITINAFFKKYRESIKEVEPKTLT